MRKTRGSDRDLLAVTLGLTVAFGTAVLAQGGPGDPGRFPCNAFFMEEDLFVDVDVNTQMGIPSTIEFTAEWNFECLPEDENLIPKTCKWCIFIRTTGWEWHPPFGSLPGHWTVVTSTGWVFEEALQDVCNWPTTGGTDSSYELVGCADLRNAGAHAVTVEFGLFPTHTNGTCGTTPGGSLVEAWGTYDGYDLDSGDYVLIEED